MTWCSVNATPFILNRVAGVHQNSFDLIVVDPQLDDQGIAVGMLDPLKISLGKYDAS